MDLQLYTKEFKTNIKIAIPVMLGQLGHVLVGFTDNIMVGKLGAAPLAAVSLANSVFFILMGLGLGFSFAITPLIAEYNAAQKFKKGTKIFQHGLFLITILGILLTIMLLLILPLLHHLNQPKEVLALTTDFYIVLAFSMIPLLIFQGFKQFTDGLGVTKYAMWAIIIANVINVLLNYVLIFGKFGFPQLGIVGSAWGTLIARIIMIFLMVWFVKTQKEFVKYNVTDTWKKIEKTKLVKIIKLGYPSAMQMFFEIGVFAAGVMLAGIIGTKAQAANQIALNLSTISFMVSTGIAVTATIRVGNQKGLQHFLDLKRIAYSTMLLMMFFAVSFATVFILFRNYLPLIYIQDTAVVAIAAQLLIVSGLFQISDGIQVVVLGALRGLQDMVVPMRLIFISYWVIGFPICYYLGLHTSLGAVGVWIGLLVGLTVAAILLFSRFQYLTNKLILQQKNN